MRIFGKLCRFGEGDNLGTCSLPLEDQEWRINEHNVRKLWRNIGEIQGGCPPSLIIKGSQATPRGVHSISVDLESSGLNHPKDSLQQFEFQRQPSNSKRRALNLCLLGVKWTQYQFQGSFWQLPCRINRAELELGRSQLVIQWIDSSRFHFILRFHSEILLQDIRLLLLRPSGCNKIVFVMQ